MIGLAFSLFWGLFHLLKLLLQLVLLPLKLLDALGGSSNRRGHRQGHRSPAWTHDGCTIRHRSRETAQRCTKGRRTVTAPAAHLRLPPPPRMPTGYVHPRTVNEIADLVGVAYSWHDRVDPRRRQMLSGLIATLEWVQQKRPRSIASKSATVDVDTIRRELAEAHRYYYASGDLDLQSCLTGVVRACEWLLRMSEEPLRP